MTLLYLILGAFYLVGCVCAYHVVKHGSNGEWQPSFYELVKYTLGSWFTVLVSMLGRVQ